ncbi:hypothetical protein B0J18DRAFT_374545, partial [Chaetomium sp. MPI-SDFR-AT-0129]
GQADPNEAAKPASDPAGGSGGDNCPGQATSSGPPEWAKSQNLSITKVDVRAPCLLKQGSISTSVGEFAVLIPFPFQDCAVQHQPNKHDTATREPVDWLDPVLLLENSALILLNGEIKFWPVICYITGAQDDVSKVDRTDIREEEKGQPH